METIQSFKDVTILKDCIVSIGNTWATYFLAKHVSVDELMLNFPGRPQ